MVLLFLLLPAAGIIFFLTVKNGSDLETVAENDINYTGQYGAEVQSADQKKDSSHLQMVIFKVGKADAILLSSEGKNILIDTGEEDDGEELLHYMQEKDIHKIDAMILTHFDKDHIGGADIILDNMEVVHVYQPDYDSDSEQFMEYDNSVKNNNVTVETLSSPVNFTCGGMKAAIYPPLKKNYEQENDFSLVISIAYGEKRFLFAGDAETQRLKELVSEEQEIDGGLAHSFLKIPHHGREEKELSSFLTMVVPEYAVITCSAKNPPDEEVLALLKERQIKVFLTSDGNVYGDCDGKKITIWQ